MKDKKYNSYEEYEWMEMEKFIKNKKREMDHMDKYFDDDFEEYYGDKKKRHDKDCKCKKKHHWCDDDHGHDKDDDEVFICKCKKKKDDHKKDHTCKHEHKHYHKHEYKCDKKDDKDDKKDDKHGKHDDKKHDDKRKDFANVVDFEFDQKKPKNVFEENKIRLQKNTAFPVAEVVLSKVERGDLVWLNGVVSLDNDEYHRETVADIRIIKGNNFMNGDEIYHSRIELQGDGEKDDDTSIEPFSHVDKNFECEKNVKYTVTVTVNQDDVFIPGPFTLTALQIDKKRDC